MRRVTVLNHLYNQMRRDPNFEHLRYISRFIPGMGAFRPKVMFIGASPSHEDNRNMIPFSGHTGHLLEEHITNIQLERADTFATNILKYRTPNGRPPRVDEFSWSKRYLKLEVQIVNPELIITFGQYAAFSLLPKADITKVHGQTFLVNDVTVIPMFGLHDEQHNNDLKLDFGNLHDHIQKL